MTINWVEISEILTFWLLSDFFITRWLMLPMKRVKLPITSITIAIQNTTRWMRSSRTLRWEALRHCSTKHRLKFCPTLTMPVIAAMLIVATNKIAITSNRVIINRIVSLQSIRIIWITWAAVTWMPISNSSNKIIWVHKTTKVTLITQIIPHTNNKTT